MNLAEDEIHLWMSFERPADEPALTQLTSILQHHECERLDSAHSAENRMRILAARAMQRTVLANYALGVDPAALRFVTGEHGKPALAPEFESLGLHFNLTHTVGLVALAVGRHRDIGLDAENIHERTTALRLARRYFTAEEARDLEALPLARQPERFYSLWTLKESWMKATGRGVGAGLDKASFSLDDDHQLQGLSFAAYDASDWRFWQYAPSKEHVLALALRAPGATRGVTVATREWRPAEMGAGA
ncbi:MAG: 4'-phosphopantetheinyl transferase superfamily protein [Pseudomonadota bacterium]